MVAASKLSVAVAAAAHVRRSGAAMAAIAAAVDGKDCKKRKDPSPFSWTDHLLRMTESEFKLRYRLNFDSFMKLLGILREDLAIIDSSRSSSGAVGTCCLIESKQTASKTSGPSKFESASTNIKSNTPVSLADACTSLLQMLHRSAAAPSLARV